MCTRLQVKPSAASSRELSWRKSYGLPPHEINVALQLIKENEDVIRRAWHSHFC